MFYVLPHYCAGSKVTLTSSLSWELSAWRISCPRRPNPLPLFTLGIYFPSDPLAQLPPDCRGYDTYGWPTASQTTSLCIPSLAPMANNDFSSAAALHSFYGEGRERGRGKGWWTSSLSGVSANSKPTTGTGCRRVFFLITISQLPNAFFIITSMMGCCCPAKQESSLSSQALGE